MSKPIVSICCITYNHENYIRQCLDGFLMQKCDFEYEIIIHDDASTDSTPQIIEEYQREYPSIIKSILQKENKYTKGEKPFVEYLLPLAKGKYIAFCEGDDFWTNDLKLQKQYDFLELNSDFSFCGHYVSRLIDKGYSSSTLEEVRLNTVVYKEFASNEMFTAYIPTLSLFFRNVDLNFGKDLYKAKNGDAVLIGLLGLHGKGAILAFCGATYRIHSDGVFSGVSYIDNLIRTIESRIVMLESESFLAGNKKLIDVEIRKRCIKGMKYSLKRLNFVDFIKFVKFYIWH